MNRKLHRNFVLFFLIFVSATLSSYSAEERVINSLSSSTTMNSAPTTPLANGAALRVQDQWLDYMIANPLSGGTPYTDVFRIQSHEVDVVLRYDDHTAYATSSTWTLTVTYDIWLYDELTYAVSPLVYHGEQLTINYDPAHLNTYSDIARKQYPGFYKAKIVVKNSTGIQYTECPTPCSPVSTLPSYLSDVYLDAEAITNRLYALDLTQSPVIKEADNASTRLTGHNELALAWTYLQGAESYDLEWVFADVPSASFGGTINQPYDWDNATRINTTFNNYNISLGYPRGVILYRVRAVAIDPSYGIRLEGEWTYAPSTFDLNVTSTAALGSGSYYRHDFSGNDLAKNWQYSSAFAEDGKRKEMIGYFDGSLRNRQSSTVLNTDSTVVIGETEYDYEGRPAVQIIPTPLTSSGIHYYDNFNPVFNKDNFDLDTKINSPDAMTNTTSGAWGSAYYYSSLNTSTFINNAYTPDAGGYGYSQTRYKTDGTGRLRSQSGIGPDHKLGSNHETKYFYGTPTGQNEIDRLFGNEVGNVFHYQKNMVQDPNGQISISYLDQEGRVVATCLSGNAPDNLLAIDNQPTGVLWHEDLLQGKNQLDNNMQMVSTSTILVSDPSTVYSWSYGLSSANYCAYCGDLEAPLCETCKYDLQIDVTDEDGFEISGYPYVQPNISTASHSFTITFPSAGSYTVTKTLKANSATAQQYLQDFKEYVMTQFPSCVDVPLIEVGNCNTDCHHMCREEYIQRDGNGVFLGYLNNAGVSTDSATAIGLMNTCETNCNSGITTQETECEVRLKQLKIDMSPGGQYFDNMPAEYTYDGNGNVVGYNSSYASSDINDWLDGSGHVDWTRLATNLSANCSVTLGASTGAWLRANWQDCFADQLVLDHPEYCKWQYFCESQVCNNGGAVTTYTYMGNNGTYDPSSFSNDYDTDMYTMDDDATADGTPSGYFNPTGLGTSTTHSTSDFTNGNITYQFGASHTNDPYFSGDCIQLDECSPDVTAATKINDMLQKFYPIPSTSPQKYFSIWYVLNDPDGIHTCTSSCPPASTIAFFQSLLGDGTNPGLIGMGSGQISKYQYFRSVYQAFKKLIQYKRIADSPTTTSNCGTPAFLVDAGSGYTSDGFQIRYNNNPVFDAYDICEGDPSTLASNFGTNINTDVTAQCSTACSTEADNWIDQLKYCGLTTMQKSTIKTAMISLCQSFCSSSSPSFPDGYSGCATCPSTACLGAPCNSVTVSSTTCYTFDQIVTAVLGHACEHVVQPAEDPTPGHCSCHNMFSAVEQAGYDINSSADLLDITAYVNGLFGTTYTGSDIEAWRDYCQQTAAPDNYYMTHTLSPVFPGDWLCPDSDPDDGYDAGICSCSNLHTFIDYFDLDPTDYTMIAAMLNKSLNPVTAYTSTQVSAWLAECNDPSPDMTTLAGDNFPDKFSCVIPASSDDEDIIAAQEQSGCRNVGLLESMLNSAQVFNQSITEYVNNSQYLPSYMSNCMTTLGGRESFTVNYSWNEYHYTLYYYDQAGTLVKTVPPEAVTPLTMLTVTQCTTYVQPHRNDPVTYSTPLYPSYGFITRYKYNSMQNPIEQQRPDDNQLITNYYYDNLGRLVASQNPRQAAIGHVVSYTVYDGLGRISQVGEAQHSSTALTQIISGSPSSFSSWLSAATKTQVTKTYYDDVIPTSAFTFTQNNLKNRVSSVTFEAAYTSSDLTYDNASHYSYDIHGNVNQLVQENTSVPLSGQQLKTITYEYDLISGNVNAVHYQTGDDDQFHHRYYYDADNRITVAYSSSDNVIWEKEEKNFYYPYGSLARREIGDKEVQASDFVYTVNGWIKGVNSNTLVATRDVGKDAVQSSGSLNKFFGTDAYGYTLGYFTNDYTAVNSTVTSLANHFQASETNVGSNPYITAIGAYNLYNGNISRMVSAMTKNDQSQEQIQSGIYRYDQLNRIRKADYYRDGGLVTDNKWNTTATTNSGRYAETYHYDYNGNIYSLERAGDNSSLGMDRQQFYYYKTDGTTYDPSTHTPTTDATNRLAYVDDDPSYTGNYVNDIDDMSGTPNYTYDEIGELTSDPTEQIDDITWSVYGKALTVIRTSGSTRSDLEFVYDASGNRITKIDKPRPGGSPSASTDWVYTHYVRDAQGNVMAVYKGTTTTAHSVSTHHFFIKENHIYGSERVGMLLRDHDFSLPTGLGATLFTRTLGNKIYEFSNHLGNVLVTTNDKKLHVDAGSDGTVDYYAADVLSHQDYYSFGMQMPGRQSVASLDYRYGFNGKEDDNEMHNLDGSWQDYGMRLYDPRLCRFASVDPLTGKYPELTPYQFASNSPIKYIDLDGEESIDPQTGKSGPYSLEYIDQQNSTMSNGSGNNDIFGSNSSGSGPTSNSKEWSTNHTYSLEFGALLMPLAQTTSPLFSNFSNTHTPSNVYFYALRSYQKAFESITTIFDAASNYRFRRMNNKTGITDDWGFTHYKFNTADDDLDSYHANSGGVAATYERGMEKSLPTKVKNVSVYGNVRGGGYLSLDDIDIKNSNITTLHQGRMITGLGGIGDGGFGITLGGETTALSVSIGTNSGFFFGFESERVSSNNGAGNSFSTFFYATAYFTPVIRINFSTGHSKFH